MARPKHRETEAGTHFVTTATWQRRLLFRKQEWAAAVEEKILEYRDKDFYRLHRYVIMPDHIHVLLTPGATTSLERVVQYIKGGSSRQIGVRFGWHFPIWQPGFADQRIRDASDYGRHAAYIDLNPVKARLVKCAEEYRFASAHGTYRLDPWASGAESLPSDLRG